MLKLESRDVGDVQVTVQQFAVMRASQLGARLFKLVGPAFSSMVGADLDSDLAPALQMFCAGLDPDEVPSLFTAILAGTTAEIDGKKIPLSSASNIDLVFSGKMTALYRALGFALEVNFASFFVELRGWINAAMTKAAKSSTSPTMSPSSPGAPLPSGGSGA